MHRRRSHTWISVVTLACAALFVGSGTAQADQSFVCEDGSLVTVAHKDLTHMKQTNACVARYFPQTRTGEKLQGRAGAGAETSNVVAFASPMSLRQPQVPPLPEQADRAATSKTPAPAKRMGRVGTIDANGVETRIIETGSVRVTKDAGTSRRALPSSDYRRVLILNAADGAEKYHLHTR